MEKNRKELWIPVHHVSPKKVVSAIIHSRIVTVLLLIAAAVGLGFGSLYFAATMESEKLFAGYLADTWIVWLNLLPCIWLMLSLWFITGQAAISFTLSSLIVMGLTIASWFKVQFRNDPLMFEDLFLIKEATNMSEKYHLFMTEDMKSTLWIALAIILILAVIARGKLSLRFRMIGVLAMFICVLPAISYYADSALYERETSNDHLVNEWSSTQTYICRGFVYPFLHSIQDAIDTPPERYNEKQTEQLLASYQSEDIPEEEKVDIIGIMLEAYADFSVYDQIAFDTDPYELYHELEEESLSGNLLTNIFAGGTVDSERAFLTGFCHQGSFRSKTNSYVRYFADQGYTVTGNHPSYNWFYNRVNINENLGFESYNFMENYFNKLTDDEVAMDRILIPELISQYDAHQEESDKPYFSFNVTYQGHGPYGEEENFYSRNFVESGVYTEKTQNILNNYFGSIAETNRYLTDLVDHLRDSEEPVILILFGDHKPWLGDNSSVYQELGISLDFAGSQEGFYNYYGTRYLIWANDAAKQVLDADFEGEGPDIGPYFLMNVLFRECGWKGPAYLQAIDEASQKLPVISVTYQYLQDGEITQDLTEENRQILYDYLCLEYYERKNFHEPEQATSEQQTPASSQAASSE